MAIVVRAATVITNVLNRSNGQGKAVPQAGATFEALGSIRDGAVAIEDGRVAWTGAINALPDAYRTAELHEYRDCVVVPGFVDAHAHPLFAGDREPDFAARQRGEKALLGMLYTVAQTRKALERPQSFWPLIAQRLKTIAAHGTTTLETKTGYALHKPGEMDLLSLIDAHRDEAGMPRLVATFLGAHALPPEFTDETEYVDYLIDQCMPFAKAHGAAYADAFCEPGFFSPEQTRRYLESARAHGLRLRVHCDEMNYGAAAQMAAEIGVDAADHCNCITDQDVEALVRRDIVTVACPATIAYLDLPRRAPVSALLERGGMVALASDYNPGTSPCFNLQTVAYFGRKLFGLSAAQALYGVTIAAAKSLRVDAGTLRQGSRADLVALRLESPAEFGWQFGGNLAAAVYRDGKPAA